MLIFIRQFTRVSPLIPTEWRAHCSAEAVHYGGYPLWLALRCLPVVLVLQIVFLLLAVPSARAEQAVSLNETAGGQLLFLERDGGYQRSVLHSTSVHLDVAGLIAIVRVEQRFRNDSSAFREGVYAFPLPDQAAVRALEMRIGERRIIGQIEEKSQAKAIYQAAKQAGKKASLLEQQRPNLFTNRVANIGPGEEVLVALEYVEPVLFSGGRFSLRIPMTLTPRYMPGQSASAEVGEAISSLSIDSYLGWAQATDQVPDAAAISPLLRPDPGSDSAPINPVTITATLDAGMPLGAVTAPYHDIVLARSAGVYNIQLAQGSAEMDRDFLLQWQPQGRSVPQAALFTEKVGDEHFGMLMVVPPIAGVAAVDIPRELIFVVDTSGSMGGVSIDQAKASLALALRQLRAQDRFNLIAFSSSHRKLFRQALPASRHNLARAQAFVRQLQASGGTEMMPALRAALAAEGDSREDDGRLRQIVFITDGAVGNEDALFAEITNGLSSSRLFTVGIGSAPNSWFMRKAAEVGRGTHTHIGDLNEVGDKMGELFEQLSRPAAVNFAVSWPQHVEVWPQYLPDLYHGQPLSLAVNFGAQSPVGEVSVSADVGGRRWERSLSIAEQPEGGVHSGVGSLWARRKIEGLLDQLLRGAEESAVRAQVLPLALRHQLLSPYTSFIAVEQVISRPEDADLLPTPVPNTRPRGQAAQSFAFPRTATTAPAKAWFALLALFIGLLVRLIRQGEADHRAPDV